MVTTCLIHFLYCTHFRYNINSLEPLLIFYIALLIFLKVCNIDFQILSCKMVDNDWMYIIWKMLQYVKIVIFILKVKKLAFISFYLFFWTKNKRLTFRKSLVCWQNCLEQVVLYFKGMSKMILLHVIPARL